jgi:hypothetical protein
MVGAMAAPEGRTHAPQAAPDADAVPDHPARAAATFAQVALGLQRSAGNRATGGVLGRALLARDPVKTKPKPPVVPKNEKLAVAIAMGDVAAITGTWDYKQLTNDQRFQAIKLVIDKSKLNDDEKRSVKRLWEDMRDLPGQMFLEYELWERCVRKKVPLDRWTIDDDIDLWWVVGPKVITEYQAKRVPDAIEKLSPKEFRTLRLDLWLAGSTKQKASIVKALAAGRKMADVDKFADAIRYRSDKWLADHLNVVEEDPGAKVGPGIRQQWEMSCGPTTVQALHGQTDPIYALKLTGGGDITQVGKQAEAKKEQGKLLKGHGSSPTELGTAGTGAWVESDFNALKDATGVTYKWTPVTAVDPTNPVNGDIAKALVKIKGWLAERIYIPIVIGGKPKDTAHYNIILRYDPKSGYLIHDPGKGHSGWVTTKMIMDNKMSPPLAWSHLAGYDTPTKKAKK